MILKENKWFHKIIVGINIPINANKKKLKVGWPDVGGVSS